MKNNIKDQLQLKNKNGLEKNKYVSKIEKVGYKTANFLHKAGVLSLFSFIIFNFYVFGKEYNAYWRSRRVI